VKWNKLPSPEALGNFELLLDEELATHDEREGSSSKYRSSIFNKWK
jgi:tubulin polyglutamylase TTLL1